jgi:hypothetical protein
MSENRKKSSRDRPIPGTPDPDNWVRRKRGAEGDRRPYVKTNVGVMPGLPQHDEYDPGVVWWGSKRLYLGKQTQLRRLFHLLADHPGRWHPVSEIQEAVYELRTDASLGLPKREVNRAAQNLRRLISRLKQRIREWGMDDHVVVVPKHVNHRPGYVLLLFQDQKYEAGQAPWPKLKFIERP